MLLLASSVCGLFKWRQFEPDVILLAVGWYLRFSLSYRDVEGLLAERGLLADHVTVWRWVQRYAPELQRCLRRHLKSDSYDPQGPSVLDCGGCEGRSNAPLRSRSVRGDELNFQSPSPTFVSTTNLQHFLTIHGRFFMGSIFHH